MESSPFNAHSIFRLSLQTAFVDFEVQPIHRLNRRFVKTIGLGFW